MSDKLDERTVAELLQNTTKLLSQLNASKNSQKTGTPGKKPKQKTRGSQSLSNLSGSGSGAGQNKTRIYKPKPQSMDGSHKPFQTQNSRPTHQKQFSQLDSQPHQDFPPPYDSIVGSYNNFHTEAQPNHQIQKGFQQPNQFPPQYRHPNQFPPQYRHPNQFPPQYRHPNPPLMNNFVDRGQFRPPLLNLPPNFAPNSQHPRQNWQGNPSPSFRSQYQAPALPKKNNPEHNSSFVNLDDIIKEIIKFPGFFTTVENLARIMSKDYELTLKVIKNNMGIFSTLIDSSTKKTMVELCPSVQMCEHHIGSKGCCKKKCFDLHICPDFLMKSCTKQCSFGHSLKTNHNSRILQSLHMSVIPHVVLLKLMKKILSDTLFPSICAYYNEGNCQKKDTCSDLHICLEYVRTLGNCTNDNCSLNHDIMEKKIKANLKSFGICTNESPRDLLRIVKTKCGVDKMDDASDKTTDNSLKPQNRQKERTDKKSVESKTKFVWQMDGSIHTPLICLKGLDGQCPYVKEGCKFLHGKNPYHWQFGSGKKWFNFHFYHSEILESKFSDVNCDKTQLPNLNPTKVNDSQNDLLSLLGKKMLQVDFDSMTIDCEGPQKVYDIRHITTPSSAVSSDARSTKFAWYFKDIEGKWVLYGKSEGASSSIEKSYLENPSGKTTFKSPNGFSYEIDFSIMKQVNQKTKTERPIRRRPEISRGSDISEESTVSSSNLPKDWEPFGENETFKVVRLSSSMDEYKNLCQIIIRSMPRINISSISRIQNEYIWKQFCEKKSELMKKKTLDNLNIQKLFCGIKSDDLLDICRNNLEWRVHDAGQSKKFGNGAYFYYSAARASQNSIVNFVGKSTLLIFDVILGSVAQGKDGMMRPPDDADNNCLFDTTTDDLSNPVVYVKYNKQEYYPSYVVEFQ